MWHRNVCTLVDSLCPIISHSVSLHRAPKLYARVAVNVQGEYLQAIGGKSEHC